MSDETIRYKVVRRCPDGSLRSTKTPIPNLETIYPPGEPVEAPYDTGLLVFNWLSNAQWFAMGEYQNSTVSDLIEVWECAVDDAVKLPPMCSASIEPSRIIECWRGDLIPWAGMPWPVGTEAYRRVKLLRRVDGMENQYEDHN